MKLNRIALALLLAPLAAQAEVTFTPFATYQWFDSQTIEEISQSNPQPDIEAKEGYALGLGYRFTPALGLEANYGRTQTSTETSPAFPGSEDIRNSRLSLDGYYAFNAEGSFSPYVLLGVGQNSLKGKTSNETIEDTIVNTGIGAFYRFNEFVALRAEARNVHNTDADLDDQIALLGLEFSPGSSKAAAESAPEPVAEQAPVEELAAAPLAVVAMVDTDGDGVSDASDRCAGTPAGVQVDGVGCPLDADKDGVADYLDKCPNTASGVVADSTGCDKVLVESINKQLSVTFDSGKTVVKSEYKAEIAEVAALLKQYPATSVEIQGHTDSSGKKASNDTLSQARADAVKEVLVKENGVDASRVTAKGYGSSQSVADNNTAEGKAKNRRVIAIISGEAKKVQKKK